ncbi:MAG: site-specific DNA-methyltransferase [Spirochaetota bacterium]|nr:site-specific DNA-methyltransferase [Spirochaetota bacterium]
MRDLKDNSVHLILTSPPYPMIEMWDNIFTLLNPAIGESLINLDGSEAFHLMHLELNKVWKECYRVLSPGGIACINIGDATRKIGHHFMLYSNHYKILQACHEIGFHTLPLILWRKQTNAPNKFMGSGMLPSGAYVTLEHEYILIFRKGAKRDFPNETDKKNRQESAFFWEERNIWFSDVWDFKGVKQRISGVKSRDRSGAFPFELAYRLINMHSVKGDSVLDPFVGTGTTILAAIASNRNSIGMDIDLTLKNIIEKNLISSRDIINNYLTERYNRHIQFVGDYEQTKSTLKYINKYHHFPVMTRQERNLKQDLLDEIRLDPSGVIQVTYCDARF